MSDDYKAILQQANARIVAGDIEGFLRYCTDDTQWTFIGEQVINGKPALRKYLEATYVQPPKFDVREMIAEGNSLAALGEITLTDKNGK
ncbi:MAG: nuclear transport factor 2 family protein, partial [Pseudomonadota bacterium]|nr:nuclear transport factor 2 family protein [Pseudomonadota bacterium]